jgi:HprK-related kinase A
VKVSEISTNEVRSALRDPGIRIRTGPFAVHVKSSLASVAEGIQLLYKDFPYEPDGFADFHVKLVRPRNLHRLWHPQVVCYLNEESPFAPLPMDQALAVFESLLNWSIYATIYHYLIIHAAAVERNGFSAILPAPPGSGKSTLCAALVSRGWRLLTDELTLVSPSTGLISPMARPISLKNNSIDVMQRFAPRETFSPKVYNTIKGTIAYMRAPTESVTRVHETAAPTWLIFPKYQAGASTTVKLLPKGAAFMRLSSGLVNYSILGAVGFDALTRLIDGTDCYDFTYSNLEEAMAWFDQMQPPSRSPSTH